jgi:hypothetical protein
MQCAEVVGQAGVNNASRETKVVHQKIIFSHISVALP